MTEKEFKQDGESFCVGFTDDIRTLKGLWSAHVEEVNTLMSYSYLLTIQQAPPDRIGFLYGVLYSTSQEPLCFYYFQYKPFNAGESLNYTIEDSVIQKVRNSIKRTAASWISSYGLVCGNLLVTGNHGNCWIETDFPVDRRRFIDIMVQHLAFEHSNEQGKNIGFILSKDHEVAAPTQPFIEWNSVNVQPNMVLYLDKDWHTMEDYLNAMTSKYRKRIKSAQRKVDDFHAVEAGVEEIKANIEAIYRLYLEIVDRAPFNMFILSKSYFIELKENLGDLCDFTLVYDEKGALQAFQINIDNGEEYEAHFLGYNHDYVKSKDIYLNLLLNSVDQALKREKKSVIFSRTAMQIKSSIGAVPEELYLYLVLRNKFLNKLVKLAFRYFNPPVVFDQRHPFK